MNTNELHEHLTKQHPGISLATGPTGKYPEGRPEWDLVAAHESQHKRFPEAQNHKHTLNFPGFPPIPAVGPVITAVENTEDDTPPMPRLQATLNSRFPFDETESDYYAPVTLRRALEYARDLHDPDAAENSGNPEYTRGIAEVIMDLFGLIPHDEHRTLVTEAITYRITVDAALSELAAQTGIDFK